MPYSPSSNTKPSSNPKPLTPFDPNGCAVEGSGIFGLPYSAEESRVQLLPIPWEVTTSYGGGTSEGPEAILEASKQLDLYHHQLGRPYEAGFCMLPLSEEVQSWNNEGKTLAQKIIAVGGNLEGQPHLEQTLAAVNQLSEQLNRWVLQESRAILAAGKILGVVGGDHSVPFGALQAVAEREPSFGVLHIDAHADLRIAYEGFQHSHASIFWNAIEAIPQISKLVQIGLRDFCEQERTYALSKEGQIQWFTDAALYAKKANGSTWNQITQEIIQALPEKVWISFDIDGLDPRFCPHTGTPVPGGLDYREITYLIEALARSGRKILGFDLVEVAPGPSDEWDANVGMRLLYELCSWSTYSQSNKS